LVVAALGFGVVTTVGLVLAAVALAVCVCMFVYVCLVIIVYSMERMCAITWSAAIGALFSINIAKLFALFSPLGLALAAIAFW
jgi:hypothetical protein